jgi:hypothetical protein
MFWKISWDAKEKLIGKGREPSNVYFWTHNLRNIRWAERIACMRSDNCVQILVLRIRNQISNFMLLFLYEVEWLSYKPKHVACFNSSCYKSCLAEKYWTLIVTVTQWDETP